MSTILLNVHDSIVSCDTVVVKLAEVCQPNMAQKVLTTEYDVDIAFWICCALVVLGLIAAMTLLILKVNLMNSEKKERQAKEEKEKVEAERKQKGDILDKYLDFLKERASKKDDGSYDGNAGNDYKRVLVYLIELSQNDKMMEFSYQKLQGILKHQGTLTDKKEIDSEQKTTQDGNEAQKL